MNGEKISLEEKERQEFYIKFGSRQFKLQREVFKEYGSKKLELYFKFVEFTYKIVTTIGIVAGFGFTALSSIQYRGIFAIGEAFLFIGMLLGIYLVHSVYSGEVLSLQKAQGEHKKHFRERNMVFKRVWEDLNDDGVSPSDIGKLKDIDEKTLDMFDSDDDGTDHIKTMKSYQRLLIYFLVAGCATILFSIAL